MKFKKWLKKRIGLISVLSTELEDAYDVEALHQYRINLRKLHSYSEVYAKKIDEKGSKEFSKLIKFFLKPTVVLRDLDLFLIEIDAIECSQQTKEQLYKDFNSQREQAFEKFMHILQSSEYKQKLKKLKLTTKDSGFLMHEVKNIDKDKIIKDKEKEIYNEYKRVDDNTSFEELHKLRKEFKKFRYGFDIYRQCFNKSSDYIEKISDLKVLQDIFGSIQDCYVRLGFIKGIKDQFTKEQWAELEIFFSLKLQNARQELFLHRDKEFT